VNIHKNAKTTPKMRALIVERRQAGETPYQFLLETLRRSGNFPRRDSHSYMLYGIRITNLTGLYATA